MIDIRQSPQFAKFMKDLGWRVGKIDFTFVYLKKFPLIGYFAKMPRPVFPLSISKIIDFKKKHSIFRLKISPHVQTTDINYQLSKEQFLKQGFKIENSPFNPTTDIFIDLTPSEEIIFKNFIEAKRRGVRRAIKNSIIVKESDEIESFIKIRQKQYFPVGFLIVDEMKKLWKNFYPKNASLLLAYSTIQNRNRTQMQATAYIGDQKPVAGVLLLFYDQIAYYWYASSLKIGKKLFAPTLLVWEALKLSKKRGCKIFDFEGIYDERFPKAAASWRGFTKFKEGFGGKKVVYMENFYL